MTNIVTKIQFYDTDLDVAIVGDRPFVAVKPICEALGLDWGSQHKLIVADPVLSSTISVTETVGADGKSRKMVCLPLDYLNGWLFKINARRYKGERQALIIRYQRECYRVLAAHFLGRPSSASSATIPPPTPSPLAASPCPAVSTAPITHAAAMDAIRAAVERTAKIDAANIRFDMLCLAERYKITEPEEFMSLAATAVFPCADASAVGVHPGTFRRAVGRLLSASSANGGRR